MMDDELIKLAQERDQAGREFLASRAWNIAGLTQDQLDQMTIATEQLRFDYAVKSAKYEAAFKAAVARATLEQKERVG